MFILHLIRSTAKSISVGRSNSCRHSVSPIVENLFLDSLETSITNNLIKIWLRYVDKMFAETKWFRTI